MRISTKYDFGDTVYIKTDNDQLPRVVTGIILGPGHILYEVSQGTNNSRHYDFELSTSVDVVLKTND